MNKKTRHEISNELSQIVGYSELAECDTNKCSTLHQNIRNSVYRIDALMAQIERRRNSDILTSYTKNKTVTISNILSGKKIMIVDDVIENQNMLENIFSLFKCNTKCASSGVDALKLYENYKPDIVCMDIVMTGMQGDEVAKSLKEIGSSAKFIAVSAIKEYSSEKISIFDAWLSKPFTIDQILDTIGECYLNDSESRNNPQYIEVMDFSDLSETEKKAIIKSAKNGEISELELIINNLESTKSKEWLEVQISKLDLNIILMNLK